VHFFDDDAGQPFTRWASFMAQAAVLARRGVESHYGHEARRTYAVGTSNGGYQVRRAVEMFPTLFDGGVDWEGTYVDAGAPNLLTDLPPAILNFPDYVSSGQDAKSTAAKNILAAGYPPDITLPAPALSLWGRYNVQFWEVTQCQWQKRLDPSYDTYGSGTGTYNYIARLSASDVGANMAAFATTGRIRRPLITVRAPWTDCSPSITTPAPTRARSPRRRQRAMTTARTRSRRIASTRCRTGTTSRRSR